MAGKRSIFEEVETAEKPTAQPGAIDRAASRGNRRGIRAWLMVLFAMVVVMIVVGGLTRLTDSGLSITEWKPVTGAMPPMSEAAWEAELEKYRAIPEYQLQNKGMSLSEFKTIYWWEWGHRQLGRVIGLVWAMGFFWFLVRKQIPTGWTGRLVGIGALGGLQGAIGWWMVSSGLTGEMLDVASYRLATHLGLAFVILGLIAWYVFMLGRTDAELMQARRSGSPTLTKLTSWLIPVAYLQIIVGALVAGIDAGRTYTDWPLMAGDVFPTLAFEYSPVWRNFFESEALVQFNHRTLGYILFLFSMFIWWRSRSAANRAVKQAFDWVAVMMFGQLVLGIGTVLYAAPWHLAIIHQLGAVVLICLILRARFLSIYPTAQSVRT
ncbi:cytochrome c oxidase assembly protein subunit 15 [Litoreibacter ascidiaceicola]|uniref:Heme A synthase n=1 Tax=Litoreibacter ascidiaceicola TaxID=1486859 RepID=A0A1M4VYS6_9RHOB|nr:heme A synthase [Litoreibacter ascidiaceicola]SHE74055.1 cytochrome c oxidase assembly protein subunit 15 [Litoreibacter ascidiaceicola]